MPVKIWNQQPNKKMRIQKRDQQTKSKMRSLALAMGMAANGVFLTGFSQAGTSLTWNLAIDGAWDSATANWTTDGGSTTTTFASDGTEDALFAAGTAGHRITISPSMSPASTTVSGGDYTFSGNPISSGSLIKSGTGTLSLEVTPANFSSIAVNGGTLYLHAADKFAANGASFNMGTVTVESGASIRGERANMTGSLTLNGGTYAENNGFGGSWTGPVVLTANSIISGGYNQSLVGVVTGPGGLTHTGGGTLILNGISDYTGKTVVQSGGLNYQKPLSNAGVAGPLGAPPAGPDSVIDLYPGTTFVYGGPQGSMSPPLVSTDRIINLAGSGSGTVTLNGSNVNDTGFRFGGISATGTGTRTLLINCRGDRPVYTYTSGIPDMSDSSQVSLTCTWSSGSSSSNGLINLQGINTFTGPMTLNGGGNGGPGTFLIGGSASNSSTIATGGTAVLGNGTYAGNITFTASPATVLLNYASGVDQTLSGIISGPGALTVSGTGILTLAGTNTYSGNTTVISGSTLVIDSAGALTFKPTSSTACNKLTGAGTATLNGAFNIDTSGVTSAIASWTVVDITNKTYGSSFSLTGFSGSGGVWTNVIGFTTWTFSQASGVLSVNTLSTITAFGIPGHNGAIVQGSSGTIALSVPFGTDLSTLAPTFTATSGTVAVNGVTVSSGSAPTPGFSVNNPTTYTVTDGAAVNSYVVTVTVAPAPPAGLGVDAGLVAWYDASQLSGLSNGNSVDVWADLSSYGHKASRTAGTMTYATSQVNGLPTVQFRSQAYANITGTLFAKEQYIVFKSPTGNSYNGDWGAILGDVTDQHGYMMGNGTNFWNGNYPAAVSQNGTVLVNPWNITNMGTFLILKIDGLYPDTNPRSYSLGNAYGNGSPQYHNNNLDVAEIIAYDHVLTAEQELALGAYLTVKYNITASTYPTGPQATITSFTFPTNGDASITGTTITKYVPNGTTVTALAPTFTLSADATCVPVSGSTHNFSTPVHYLVTASDSTTKDYTVTVTVLPPGPPVGGFARWFDASALGLADTTPVAQWNDSSGNSANATVPSGNATPVYVANSGMESGLGAIYFAKNGGAGNSAAFKFTEDTTIRTVFSVFKGNSFLLTDTSQYHFHRNTDDNATDPLWTGPTSGNVTGGSTYVNGALVNGSSFAMPTTLHGGFNLVEVLTTGNVTADSFNKDRSYHAGNQYQAEVIIYDRLLSEQERLQVEAYLTSKWFTAPVSGYASWAAQHVGGQTAEKDYNHDGVQNGIAYLMGATGVATLPGIVNGKLAWPHDATAVGITWKVQTSQNLQTWTDVTADAVDADGFVTYTLPKVTTELFVRLEVLAP